MKLRPYQSAAADAIFAAWQEKDSTLVVMPTGGGKTILFADVIRRMFPRRALVFTASVKAAEMTAEIFNRHRAGMASWVCGKTDREEQRRVLADFAAGKLQVVCNCGVLTEGFDDPGVEVIIMGRPTKSRSLYSQMVGRSTRPLPGVVDGPETAEEELKHQHEQARLRHCRSTGTDGRALLPIWPSAEMATIRHRACGLAAADMSGSRAAGPILANEYAASAPWYSADGSFIRRVSAGMAELAFEPRTRNAR